MKFFEELKRRRVVRVALLYAAASYAIVQIADLLQPALLLPEWTVRLVLLLVLLGTPITLVLAWMLDVGPEGISSEVADDEVDSPAVTPATIVGAVLLVGIGLAAGVMVSGRDGGVASEAPGETISDVTLNTPSLASIAVLPLEDLSPEGDQAAFVDGISEEIRNALSRVPALQVASRNSSFAYRGQTVDSREVGQALGVSSLLEGSLRKDGSTIRVTVELVNTEDGLQIWSNSYTEELEGIFELQEDVARTIVGELQVPLQLDAERFLVPQRTDNVDAYQTYLRARELFRQRGDSLLAAVPLLRQVIAQDSMFVPALALLAEALPIMGNGTSTDQVGNTVDWIRQAQAAADRAVSLDSAHAQSWAALGTVARERLDWDAAERHLKRATELDPNYAEAHSNLGEVLGAVGRVAEARPHHLRALALDPGHFVYRFNYTWLAFTPRYNEETLPHARYLAEQVPSSLRGVGTQLFNLAALGRFEEAWTALREAKLAGPVDAAVTTILSDMEAGRQTDAGRAAFQALFEGGDILFSLPSNLVVYGDLEMAARRALDLGWAFPYMWGGYLAAGEELRGYHDYDEARRRRNLPP
ncbi:MAG: tetratricopeptide repeat protein [Longimicrobiales bacterium]